MSLTQIRASINELVRVVGLDPNMTRPEHQHTKHIVESLKGLLDECSVLDKRVAVVEEKLKNIHGPIAVIGD